MENELFESSQMRKLTRIAHMLIADVTSSKDRYGGLFRETLNVDYVEICYREFESSLAKVSKPFVLRICDRLNVNPNHRNKKRPLPEFTPRTTSVEVSGDGGQIALGNPSEVVLVPEFDFRVGRRLFELYLALKEFNLLGNEVLPGTGDGRRLLVLPEASQGPHPVPGAPAGPVDQATAGAEACYPNQQGFLNFHMWFVKAIAKWLDIALLEAVKRILKAVKLDGLRSPVDDLVKHTSSAVDIRTVFGQITTFWDQLAWPDPETAYVFISRILDDVCKAAVFYAENMCQKVEEGRRRRQGPPDLVNRPLRSRGRKQVRKSEAAAPTGRDGHGQGDDPQAADGHAGDRHHPLTNPADGDHGEGLHFSHEQCHALNNIDFILQAIRPLPDELGMKGVVEKIEQLNGGLVADACRKTTSILVRNSLDNVENQLLHASHIQRYVFTMKKLFTVRKIVRNRSCFDVFFCFRFYQRLIIFLREFQVLELSCSNIAPHLTRLLLEINSPTPTTSRRRPSGQEGAQSSDNSTTQARIDALVGFLDANLIFLKANLVPENFERVLSVVWSSTADSLVRVIRAGIVKRRPTSYFVNLRHAFRILLNFFFGNNNDDTSPTTRPSSTRTTSTTAGEESGSAETALIHWLLKIYSCSGNDLLLTYYDQRYAEQRALSSSGSFPIGSLTLRALTNGSHLRVELLNARHLKPLDVQRKELGPLGGSLRLTRSSSRSIQSSTGAPSGPGAAVGAVGHLGHRQPALPPCDSLNLMLFSGEVNKNWAKAAGDEDDNGGNGDGDVLGGQRQGSPGRDIRSEAEERWVRFRERLDEMRINFLHEAALIQRTRAVHGNSSQTCNPYVSIRLVPDLDHGRFHNNGLPKVKSKVQERTLFPL